ncbi:MAG: hypothetical protein CM15mP68_7310 [Pseudomonadota bacterium]|nr:MAG: hypothetical protein CM15mP68_7310 [Pseudomonadota bacterium]
MTASSELPRRRFIAGAVCPKCQALDRMVLEVDVDDNEQTRHCVACGFSETLQAKSTRNAQCLERVSSAQRPKPWT